MKTITLSMLLLPMLGTAESAKPTALMEGKVETGRTIFLEVTLNAPSLLGLKRT
ncbi:MAG: hypothetical protein ABIU29_01240 [Chthoniobacterales bacterium]